MTIKYDEICELMEDSNTIEGESGSWRWGHTQQYIVKRDDKYYSFVARFHVEEGLQDEELNCVEVKPVEKIVIDWIKV